MTLYVADVSEFQHYVDWASYGAATPAVIVRLHNSYRPDLSAARNIIGARRYCAWRGWYQYLAANADPVKAAHDFQATLGPTLPGEAMILDLEEGAGDQHSRRAAWINALQDPIEWTYSGLSFARAHLAGTRVEWLAAYGQGEPTDPHTLWQFTNARRFPGISAPCDASTYSGTLAQLQALTHAPITSKDDDMALTISKENLDAISERVVTDLLTAKLGKSDTNVGQALQQTTALRPLDPVAFAKAVAEALPATTGGAVSSDVLEAVVRKVFSDAGAA